MNEHENKPTKKYFYIFLSLLVAVVMWIYVDEMNKTTIEKTFEDIPVTYVDTYDELSERGLMLVRGEDSTTTETIDLTIEGKRTVISHLDEADIIVTVDVSSFDRVGNRQRANRTVSFADDRFGSLKVNASTTVTVDIAELNRRTVDVRCELIGNVAEGYSAGEVQLSATEVELRGQTKDIDPVSYVKISFDIGTDAEESVTQELMFQYYDRNDNLLDGDGIIPTVETITAKLPVYVTKELPLVINYKEAPGARLSNTIRSLEPSTITVSGDASQLKNVKNIVLGDIDLLELTDGSTRYETTFPIIIPDGCKNLSGVTRATLKIQFNDLSTTEILADRFDYENLPAGKTATILTEELAVRIFGLTNDIDELTPEDILVVADLSDYGAASGTYTVPATVTITNGVDVGILGEYQVQARIQQAETTDQTEEPDHITQE